MYAFRQVTMGLYLQIEAHLETQYIKEIICEILYFMGVEKTSSLGSAEYNLEVIKLYDPHGSLGSKIL